MNLPISLYFTKMRLHEFEGLNEVATPNSHKQVNINKTIYYTIPLFCCLAGLIDSETGDVEARNLLYESLALHPAPISHLTQKSNES